MNGLIVIAHGSKKDVSNNEFRDLVNKIRKIDKSFKKIEAAFLEFAIPNIDEVVKELLKDRVSKIYLYPYFLNSGKHVIEDLPKIITILENRYSNVDFILLEHFWKSDKISEIILDDIGIKNKRY